MKALVLTYHSNNVFGTGYHENDHVALAEDLRVLTQAGARFVSLDLIVEALRAGLIDPSAAGHPLVSLTFDDGPVFDVQDFTHPIHGYQRSFLNTMLDFAREYGDKQPALGATSFVIASPEARAAMEVDPECGYVDQGHWLTDSWWPAATGKSPLRLGNHSWDHVHPAAPAVAIGWDGRGDFTAVDNYQAATGEVRDASRFIETVIGEPCRHFAYPYGQANRYLAEVYFPEYRLEHHLIAAFTTEGRPLAADDSIWKIPRLVCGDDWTSSGQLVAFVRN